MHATGRPGRLEPQRAAPWGSPCAAASRPPPPSDRGTDTSETGQTGRTRGVPEVRGGRRAGRWGLEFSVLEVAARSGNVPLVFMSPHSKKGILESSLFRNPMNFNGRAPCSLRSSDPRSPCVHNHRQELRLHLSQLDGKTKPPQKFQDRHPERGFEQPPIFPKTPCGFGTPLAPTDGESGCARLHASDQLFRSQQHAQPEDPRPVANTRAFRWMACWPHPAGRDGPLPGWRV